MNTMATAGNNSLYIGVFTDSGNQITFVRMITATAIFTYLADFLY